MLRRLNATDNREITWMLRLAAPVLRHRHAKQRWGCHHRFVYAKSIYRCKSIQIPSLANAFNSYIGTTHLDRNASKYTVQLLL